MLHVILVLFWDLIPQVFYACPNNVFFRFLWPNAWAAFFLQSVFFFKVLPPLPLHSLAKDPTEPNGKGSKRKPARRTYKTALIF